MGKKFLFGKSVGSLTIFAAVSIAFLLIASFFLVYRNSGSWHKQFNPGETNSENVELMGDVESINPAEEAVEEQVIEEDLGSLNPEYEQENTLEPEPDSIIPPASDMPIKVEAPVAYSKHNDDLRIGFITDLHVRSDSTLVGESRWLKQVFIDRINKFVNYTNQNFQPDAVVINGDVIEGTGKRSSIGIEELRGTKQIFDNIPREKYWVVGNHDLRSVDKKQWQQALGIDYLYKAFDLGDYRIMILDSNFASGDVDVKPDLYYTRGRVSQKEIKWIEKELKAADKKVIIFMHHPPLWNVDSANNDRFPSNSLQLQELFSKYKVLAVFSGHIEDLFAEKIDGVKYFVLPGLVKNEKYQGTFTGIRVNGEEFTLEVRYLGKDGKYKKVTIKK